MNLFNPDEPITKYAVLKEDKIGTLCSQPMIAIGAFIRDEKRKSRPKTWKQYRACGYDCYAFELLNVGRVDEHGYFPDGRVQP